MSQLALPEKGFIENLIEVVQRHPDAIAVELLQSDDASKTTWTYSEILALAERYRQVLLWLDVAPGDALAVQLAAGPEFIAFLFAAASLGVLFASINPRLTPHELDITLKDLQPAGIITAERSVHGMANSGARFLLHPGQSPCDASVNGVPQIIDIHDIPAGTSTLEPPAGNPVVTCQYTYKGLGYPLGVLHRYHDYTWCAAGIIRRFGRPEGSVHLVGLPVYSTFGLSSLIVPQYAASHLLISSRIFETNVVELMAQRQVRFACVIPLLLKRMIAGTRTRSCQATGLHPDLRIISGGSYMDRELAEEAQAVLGIVPYQGYGLSETLPILVTCPGKNKPGSIGTRILEETEVQVMDCNGRVVPDGTAGQIAIRGPSVMKEYLRRPEETARSFTRSWFRTGDLGYRDEDGYFYYLGRSSAITKAASQIVDLVEVENTLENHPAVARARVTVNLRPNLGETLIASVILRDRARAEEAELWQWCRKTLSSHKAPREFHIMEARV